MGKKEKRVVSWDTSHVLVHEFMSIYYALSGWSGNRERRNERTKRKREKEKVRSRSKIPISFKPAVKNFVPIIIHIMSSSVNQITTLILDFVCRNSRLLLCSGLTVALRGLGFGILRKREQEPEVVCGRCLSSTRTHRPIEWKRDRSFRALARTLGSGGTRQ
ncbi:hypothetical protein EVAR_82212_1 [Eumeta japonica]|uniref:Uncharacterized protein n=1 Tax=Eumeta variegata TaxID=151549 RepID=A0A4C1W5D2_EUMVA|nr:hypothetical protein EVAR_82212_1 [Eumeta japonica]